jgi:tetrahydromethanopterin S-methyltransferase subunit B
MWGLASKEVRQLEENVKNSFASVKADTQNVYDWLHYLHQQNQDLKRSLDEKTALLKHGMTAEKVRELIDAHYSFEPILERIRAMENRIENLSRVGDSVGALVSQQKDVFAQLRELHSQVETLGTDRRQKLIPRDGPGTVPEKMGTTSALTEKMVKIAVRNSKDVIRQSILKLIRLHGQISGVALRESIVTEQGLCSKSSFYRILEELEESDDISVVDEGKEKRYFWGHARAKKQRDDY